MCIIIISILSNNMHSHSRQRTGQINGAHADQKIKPWQNKHASTKLLRIVINNNGKTNTIQLIMVIAVIMCAAIIMTMTWLAAMTTDDCDDADVADYTDDEYADDDGRR